MIRPLDYQQNELRSNQNTPWTAQTQYVVLKLTVYRHTVIIWGGSDEPNTKLLSSILKTNISNLRPELFQKAYQQVSEKFH
jgi:hypothetical protein